MKLSIAALVASLATSVDAALLRKHNSTATPTFQEYYDGHEGRGMWKWNVALDAYQRHFGAFSTKESKMLEIGVQSGGSILMYKQVLPKTYYYGMDINRNCEKFKDDKATIYLGDQASVPTWQHFFAVVTPNLDMCIDDGGHQSFQMLATLQQVLPHMNKGGFFLIEDIHGQNEDYLSRLFHPAADFISSHISLTAAVVESVHMYPFLFGVQMEGGSPWPKPKADLTVDSFPALTAAIPANPGKVVKIASDKWGSLFSDAALKNFFNTFYELYGGKVRQEPAECHGTMKDVCAMIATNTNYQNFVKGVHIYKNEALVELNAEPPLITAVRRGNEWIPYSGPAM